MSNVELDLNTFITFKDKHHALWADGGKDDMHTIHFTIIKPDCFGAIHRLAVCRMWNRYANKFVG